MNIHACWLLVSLDLPLAVVMYFLHNLLCAGTTVVLCLCVFIENWYGFIKSTIHYKTFINTSDSFAIPIGGERVTWVCINLCLWPVKSETWAWNTSLHLSISGLTLIPVIISSKLSTVCVNQKSVQELVQLFISLINRSLGWLQSAVGDFNLSTWKFQNGHPLSVFIYYAEDWTFRFS